MVNIIQLFVIKPDGEVHGIQSDKPIKEVIEKTECYIMNDDDLRVVYLWKGENASVRSKFIGASKSQEVRGQVGMNYKVVAIDEGGEPPEFLSAIQNPPSQGFAKEIRESMELKFEVGGGPTKPRVAQAPSYNQNIEQSGPIYTGSSGSGSSYSLELSREELNKIIDIFDQEGIPEGYEREMVIVGNMAYSVAEKVQTFLGKKQVQKVLEPISTLPEGVFFAEGYCPRVYTLKEKVIAVEFLKTK